MTVTTDAADFDVFVTLYDYLAGAEEYAVIGAGSVRARYRSGRETNVPAGVPFELVVDLTGSAHRVPMGHRLALSVSPSRCGFGENPNSGEPVDVQSSRSTATVDVELGPSGAVLVLPTKK